MMLRNIVWAGALGGLLLAGAPCVQAQTGTPNAPAPTKDDIIKALTPASPGGGQTRSVSRRGIQRANPNGEAQKAAPETSQPPSSEMQDSGGSTYFEFNSARLTPFGLKVVNEYVKALKDPALSPYAFRIVGHTDGVGSDKYNDELSQKRAQSVKNYMIVNGVDPLKLETLGLGKRELKNPANPGGAENRRVVIVNLGKK